MHTQTYIYSYIHTYTCTYTSLNGVPFYGGIMLLPGIIGYQKIRIKCGLCLSSSYSQCGPMDP